MRKTLESSGLQRHKQSQKEKKIQNEFLQKLKEDHQQVKGILGQLKESKESPLKQREELFQKLREELEPHMKAEEKTFYQPLMKKKEALRIPYEQPTSPRRTLAREEVKPRLQTCQTRLARGLRSGIAPRST